MPKSNRPRSKSLPDLGVRQSRMPRRYSAPNLLDYHGQASRVNIPAAPYSYWEDDSRVVPAAPDSQEGRSYLQQAGLLPNLAATALGRPAVGRSTGLDEMNARHRKIAEKQEAKSFPEKLGNVVGNKYAGARWIIDRATGKPTAIGTALGEKLSDLKPLASGLWDASKNGDLIKQGLNAGVNAFVNAPGKAIAAMAKMPDKFRTAFDYADHNDEQIKESQENLGRIGTGFIRNAGEQLLASAGTSMGLTGLGKHLMTKPGLAPKVVGGVLYGAGKLSPALGAGSVASSADKTGAEVINNIPSELSQTLIDRGRELEKKEEELPPLQEPPSPSHAYPRAPDLSGRPFYENIYQNLKSVPYWASNVGKTFWEDVSDLLQKPTWPSKGSQSPAVQAGYSPPASSSPIASRPVSPENFQSFYSREVEPIPQLASRAASPEVSGTLTPNTAGLPQFAARGGYIRSPHINPSLEAYLLHLYGY